MSYFYIIAGMMLIFYPLTLLYRVREWEVKQRQEGKSVIYGFIIIPIVIFGIFLGIGMLVIGGEMLKGNITF